MRLPISYCTTSINWYKKIEIMQEKEIWKDAVGYNGVYQASSFGIIRSLDTVVEFIRCGVKSQRKQRGRILSGHPNRKGYLSISPKLNGRCQTKRIHRLVAIAFIPNPENKPEVNHINGIKTDNRVCNLEWSTGSENIRHAVKNGLINRVSGSRHHNSKLKEEYIGDIRFKYNQESTTLKQLSVEYNVSITTISNVVNNKIWNNN